MRDGENLCEACEQAETKSALARERRNHNRRERERAMRDLGLVKVRGACGTSRPNESGEGTMNALDVLRKALGNAELVKIMRIGLDSWCESLSEDEAKAGLKVILTLSLLA